MYTFDFNNVNDSENPFDDKTYYHICQFHINITKQLSEKEIYPLSKVILYLTETIEFKGDYSMQGTDLDFFFGAKSLCILNKNGLLDCLNYINEKIELAFDLLCFEDLAYDFNCSFVNTYELTGQNPIITE